MFEKACFEEKFVQLYPQSLLKFIELLDKKPEIEATCVQAMFQFVKKHGKDDEYKYDFEPIEKFLNDNKGAVNEESFKSQPQLFLKTIIRRILINGRVKHEIDSGMPVNPLFQDTKNDTAAEAAKK